MNFFSYSLSLNGGEPLDKKARKDGFFVVSPDHLARAYEHSKKFKSFGG